MKSFAATSGALLLLISLCCAVSASPKQNKDKAKQHIVHVTGKDMKELVITLAKEADLDKNKMGKVLGCAQKSCKGLDSKEDQIDCIMTNCFSDEPNPNPDDKKE